MDEHTPETKVNAAPAPSSEVAEKAALGCGVNVMDCYQCMKCSCGCPMLGDTDLPPHMIVKLAQLGQWEKLLRSRTIWMCVGCETCVTRCPNQVDIARMMDVLRQMAIEEGVAAKEANVLKFHEAFLSSIKFGGRVHEMLMTVHYKLKSGDLFSDADLAPTMLLKGKLALLPPRTRDLKSVRGIFEKTKSK